jgi:xylose isomerase
MAQEPLSLCPISIEASFAQLQQPSASNDRRPRTTPKSASWDNGIGAAIEADKEDFTSLEKYALSQSDPLQYTSGRQELLESIVNELI